VALAYLTLVQWNYAFNLPDADMLNAAFGARADSNVMLKIQICSISWVAFAVVTLTTPNAEAQTSVEDQSQVAKFDSLAHLDSDLSLWGTTWALRSTGRLFLGFRSCDPRHKPLLLHRRPAVSESSPASFSRESAAGSRPCGPRSIGPRATAASVMLT
jgi:hypothetical protein